MARLRDWLDLGKSTLNALKGSDVAQIYGVEWPETKRMLIAEHRESIELEPKWYRRWARTASAMMYGLTKRLAPHRRVLFLGSQIAFFLCLASIYIEMKRPPFWTFFEVALTFVVLTLLLGMELIDKIKYRDELELARDLQAGLIPRSPAQTRDYEVAAFNQIANTVGGDIYDFVPVDGGRLAVLFGDASGHGMAAGLVMAVAHAAFRTQLDIDPEPSSIINSLNRILCRTGGPRSFFASCYVLLSPDGTFTATVAGHPQILKVSKSGKIVERIGTGSYPLGVKPTMQWEAVLGSLEPGERLVLYSDGLTEARNTGGAALGDAYVEAMIGWHPELGSNGIVDTIVGEFRLFTKDTIPEDDVSIAVITRR